MTMTDETLHAIPAMLRAARVMKLNSDRLRASQDSRDPYIAQAVADQTRDARALEVFAQVVCLHPDLYEFEDGRASCPLCQRYWGAGESRAVAA